MKKILLIGLCTIMIFAAGCAKNENKNKQADIKVGVILPLSGEMSFVGKEMKRGMEMALEDYSNSGIKIIYEDDKTFDNKAAVNAANKLVNTDQVDVMFNAVVNTIKPVSSVLNTEEIPGLVIWDSNQTINSLGDYVFGSGYHTEGNGQKLAQLAYNKLGSRSASIVSVQDEWSELMAVSFAEEFEKIGGKIDLHERTLLSDQDFRTVVSKINEKESSTVFFPLQPPAWVSFAKQIRESGYTGYLINAEMPEEDLVELGDAAEGIYMAHVWIEDESFFEKYKTKYKLESSPVGLGFAAMGYDSVKLIHDLTQNMKERGIEINSENIRDNLIGFEFEGLTGRVKFSQDRTVNKTGAILMVKDGKLELIEK